MNVFKHTVGSASTTSAPSRTSSRSSWPKVCVGFLFALVIVHLLLGSYAGSRHRHTCVVCRLERMDYNWRFESTTTSYQETSCSKWYSAHVEPMHDHVWSPSSTCVMLNFYHQTLGVSDSEGRPGRAIWRLTPEQQMMVYQNSKDPLETRNVFLSLVDSAIMQDRHDISIASSLRDWIDSGFSMPWRIPTRPGTVSPKQ